MNNLNLCKILKGHEGEIFYSPLFGNIVLTNISEGTKYPLDFRLNGQLHCFTLDGKYSIYNAECLVFPSKDQRDWGKWVKEQESKKLKTWSDLVKNNKAIELSAQIKIELCYKDNSFCDASIVKSPAEKSALALLKIYQLIDVNYGGNIKIEEWKDLDLNKWAIVFSEDNRFYPSMCILPANFTQIAFHTKKQAEEFLKYSENIQLLKDYFSVI